MTATTRIDVKECARLIRAILKQAFPMTKFSVKLDRYSMGHSIGVRWTDGPTSKQVKPILDRFESEGFDGMTDCSYYCGKRLWRGVEVDMDGGYVRGSRDESERFKMAVADRLAYECGLGSMKADKWGNLTDANGNSLHNTHVAFNFHDHWVKDGETVSVDQDKPILAHDSLGEYFTTLVNRVCACISFEPQACEIELPEYINIAEKASTGRADFEPAMAKYEGHTEHDKLVDALASFEGVIQ